MNRKALGIAFVAGVLISGLGLGVAFAQYSKLEYMGIKYIDEANLTSGTVESTVESEGTIRIDSYAMCDNITVVTDKSIPADKIYFDVSYNPERIKLNVFREKEERLVECVVKTVDVNGVEISSEKYYEDDGGVTNDRVTYRIGDWVPHDDVVDFFEIKDELLSDLKKNRIASYNAVYIESITVRVNPVNADRVEVY